MPSELEQAIDVNAARIVGESLKTAGYTTAHVGKWHLGGKGFEPQTQGFDVNIAGDETGTPRSYFAPFKDGKGVFMPGLEEAPSISQCFSSR